MNTEHIALLIDVKTFHHYTSNLTLKKLRLFSSLEQQGLVYVGDGRYHITDKGDNMLTLLVEVFNDNVNL